MNYETIILEMLNRIQMLEEQMKEITKRGVNMKDDNSFENRKATITQHVREYIINCKNEAKEEGKTEIVLVCNDIQKALKITNRPAIVCHAMYDTMNSNDEVLYKTNSGFSTTLKIKYFL